MFIRRIILGALLAIASVAAGDVVRLKDGKEIQGEIRKTPTGWRITQADGTVSEIPLEKVASIQMAGTDPAAGGQMPPVGADAGARDLASLRRAVENISDISQIIQRYERFIEQAGNAPVVAEAKADLVMWRQRQSDGMVRVGRQWVTTQQHDELRARAQDHARAATELFKQGNVGAGRAIVEEVLAVDPQNAAAQYLFGLALAEEGQIVAAREAFERSNAAWPNHAPTLNNLAVIFWRQKHSMGALNLYDQALQASAPRHRIIDNIAEALYGLPVEHRDNALTAKLVKHFNDHESALVVEMAKEGLYRWGATWVDQSKVAELKAAEQRVQAKLDELTKEFDAREQQIQGINEDIEANERAMRRMEASRYAYDSQGRLIRLRLPDSYYEMERDNEELSNRRKLVEREMVGLRQQARLVQQEIPIPRYSGNQLLMGAEDVPLPPAPVPDPAQAPPPSEPATQPATQPRQIRTEVQI